MFKRMAIAGSFLLALLAPAMAWASTGTRGDAGGWLVGAALILGVAAAGAAGARAEGDEPEAKDPDDEDKPEGLKPSGVCASCGMGNEDTAKFCSQCGVSMAAPPLEAEDEDKPPPSSKKPGARLVAPKRASTEASIAGILGATSESPPAMKARAIDLRHVFDTAAAVCGSVSPGEIVGALLAMPEKLAAGKVAIDARAKEMASADKNERWDLAKRLNALALDGRPRSSIFDDVVNAAGKRDGVKLRPEYATMHLDVFRGLVTSLEGGVRRQPRDPFQPSRERAELAARAADPRKPPAVNATADVIVPWAKSQPAFASIRKQTPATITDEQIARQLAATMQPRGVK